MADGAAPPVRELGTSGKQFAAASTDEELQAFVNVMANGSKEQQDAAVMDADLKAARAVGAVQSK